MEADSNALSAEGRFLCGSEILCIPCSDRSYAVEFSYIVEICYQIRISDIPCLPDWFQGVFNYKGTIIPVVRLEREKPDSPENGKYIVAVVKSQNYRMGILTREEPFIIPLDSVVRVESPEGAQGQHGWCEKGIYRWEKGLFSVIDIDKTIEEMIVFK